MPVSAAAWDRLSDIAFITGINNGSEGAASATTDIPHDLFMELGHSIPVKLHILFAIHPEDSLNSTHDNTPCIT